MTVPDLHVPLGPAKTLRWLADLSLEQFEDLHDAVRTTTFPRAARSWAGALDGESRESGDRLVAAVTPLKQVQRKSDHTVSEMRAAILADERLMHGLDEEQQQALADRVGAMLSWEALAAHARAADLVDANQNLLWESRILTDIRPVFTEGNEPKATHGLVLHSLQLTYWNGAQLTELFVTLDRDELQRLAKVIERAQKKEIQAEELMKKADLPRVGTDVGVDDEGA